jgi:hypothetical protein
VVTPKTISGGENRVRLNRGFASLQILVFLDWGPKVEYLVNLAANASARK